MVKAIKEKKVAATALPDAPAGIGVKASEAVNEAADAMASAKVGGIEIFMAAKADEEKKQIKVMTKDLEVMTGVTDEQLAELQVDRRLYGWSPKTRTAAVLTLKYAKELKAKEEAKKE